MEVQSYQDLIVWQKAMDLVAVSYELTNRLPASETHGLANDLHRQARQIPSYLADGHGCGNTTEFRTRLSFAHGSVMALETDILTTTRLSFLTPEEIELILNQLR